MILAVANAPRAISGSIFKVGLGCLKDEEYLRTHPTLFFPAPFAQRPSFGGNRLTWLGFAKRWEFGQSTLGSDPKLRPGAHSAESFSVLNMYLSPPQGPTTPREVPMPSKEREEQEAALMVCNKYNNGIYSSGSKSKPSGKCILNATGALWCPA